MRPWWVFLVVGACAHNTPQDLATGGDGRLKGAKPIKLANGEARASGIVTYPGGDRVDWKQIELPKGKSGRLDLELTWRAPRPGLQVAFDVFDQWHTAISAASAKRVKGHVRSTTIPDARGTYFVRVYAPGRGDAGAYKLVADFKEDEATVRVDPTKIAIADPPKLPAVPTGTCEVFDVSDPACGQTCPEKAAPPGWAPCKSQTPVTPPVVTPPTVTPPVTVPPPKPIVAQILTIEVVGGDRIVTLGIGSERGGIDSSWHGEVLNHESNAAMPGGTVTIVSVGKLATKAKVKLSVDQLSLNREVRLSPP
jgi:hypothetical protein